MSTSKFFVIATINEVKPRFIRESSVLSLADRYGQRYVCKVEAGYRMEIAQRQFPDLRFQVIPEPEYPEEPEPKCNGCCPCCCGDD